MIIYDPSLYHYRIKSPERLAIRVDDVRGDSSWNGAIIQRMLSAEQPLTRRAQSLQRAGNEHLTSTGQRTGQRVDVRAFEVTGDSRDQEGPNKR